MDILMPTKLSKLHPIQHFYGVRAARPNQLAVKIKISMLSMCIPLSMTKHDCKRRKRLTLAEDVNSYGNTQWIEMLGWTSLS